MDPKKDGKKGSQVGREVKRRTFKSQEKADSEVRKHMWWGKSGWFEK